MMELRRWTVALGTLKLLVALHAEPVSFAKLVKPAEHGIVKTSPDGSYLATTNLVKGQAVRALIRLSDKTEPDQRRNSAGSVLPPPGEGGA